MALAKATIPDSHAQYWAVNDEVLNLHYPVNAYPEKVSSVSFDKTRIIEGRLMGIKGQYLLLDENRVLNIRKHNGYELRFEA